MQHSGIYLVPQAANSIPAPVAQEQKTNQKFCKRYGPLAKFRRKVIFYEHFEMIR